MAAKRTLDFLPNFFKTEQNSKFLSATLDQLISEPDLVKLNGYVGRKNAVNFKRTDNYLTELTDFRAHYQLEPSVVVKDKDGKVTFVTGYQDLINKLEYLGIDNRNHSRFFANEYYSYDGLIDFDKFVNFSQYYWLPNGPDSVSVYGTAVPIQRDFDISIDEISSAVQVKGMGTLINPVLIMARGGRYELKTDVANKIWIQTEPGTSGFKEIQSNVSSRDVLGVSGNGTNTIVFNVPEASAQDQYLLMNKVEDIDLATTLKYKDIQGKTVSSFLAEFGGIDGQRNIVGKQIIFLSDSVVDRQGDWDIGGKFDGEFEKNGYDYSVPVGEDQRYGIWRIPNNSDPDAVIDLEYVKDVAQNEKVFVREGNVSGNREYFKNTRGRFQLVPVISVVHDRLYYQIDGVPNANGEILLVDPLVNVPIDVEKDILGKKGYLSPNGVIFTNGLKVEFDESVTPAAYAGKVFYVEGVGSAIRLVDARLLITPEVFTENSSVGFDTTAYDVSNYDEVLNAPKNPVYITINRSSKDLNPWSRNNRWFHEDVINATAKYNNFVPVIDQNSRASRPIIEFDADLALFNHGRVGKTFVNVFNTTTTDAFGYTSGNTEYLTVQGVNISSRNVIIDGVALTPGMRIIFANDVDETVRNKVYEVSYINPTGEAGGRIIHLTLAADGNVNVNDSIVVTQGIEYQGKSFWFNGENWQLSQQMTSVNQEPLFDVFDSAGNSLSDSYKYPNSTFTGTKLFSYKRGTGVIDRVLGFPLSYRNFNNVGDIVFENNYVKDIFGYGVNSENTSPITAGMPGQVVDRLTILRRNIWKKITEDSKQYQQFSFFYDGSDNLFNVGIQESSDGDVPNTKVLVNNNKVSAKDYSYVTLNDAVYLKVSQTLLTAGDKVDIYIFNSTEVSNAGFYQVPTNLDNNSVNVEFDTVTLGQMRNHVAQCYENSIDVTGVFPGASNIRDLVIKNNPGKILQHSAPLPLAMLFLNNDTASFERALDLARREYTRFKNKFMEMAYNADYVDESNVAATLDQILLDLNSYKTADMPWFTSDMVPYGDDKIVIKHTVVNSSFTEYEINQVFDASVPSNRAVLVYLNGSLLLKDVDYTFGTDRPAVILTDKLNLNFGDIIEVVDYNNTDGCWIPETPTKLGLYPLFTPEIRVDHTFREAKTVIQGHDGSLTFAFGDVRDELLLELEKRIYNNIKVKYNQKRFDLNSVTPGKFRNTAFTNQEFNTLLSNYFLKWVGTNRLSYKENTFYNNSDGFTWNYSQFVDKLTGDTLPGSWRGIYKYFFDCEDPSTRPWEMLGFSEQPAWWVQSYGPAPYTSGNLVLWEDLAAGRILFGDRAGIDPLYARPGLLDVLPVSEYGDLLSPHEFIVKQYEVRNTAGQFVVGDYGPVESAWKRTSEYPYAVQYAVAITSVAKYFGLQLDTHAYVMNDELGQFIVAATNKRLTKDDIKVPGAEYDGVVHRASGYLNWIADYVRSLGMDALDEVGALISNFDVQLSYKMAGFSDKKMLKIYAEQASPTSTNESIIIPDEDYELALNKSVPIKRIVYSGVIVSKTDNGWSVEGYNTDKPFFTIIPSDTSGIKKTITENQASVFVYINYLEDLVEIPYGTEFTSRQQVVDFLISYERFLIGSGFVFGTNSKELGETLNWTLAAREFLTWSQQGWGPGNVIVLSPVANSITLRNDSFIVDSLNNNKGQSKVLDLNFVTLRPEDFRVSRDAQFTTVTLNNSAVGMVSINAVQMEHVIVFNNKTVFNDIIYQPELGNRQTRIKIIGQKTGAWDGSLTAPGFILNYGSAPAWQPGKDYKKADIVEYKGRLFAAAKDLVSQDSFNYNDWVSSDYSEIKQGLLPNFATRSGNVEKYYDIDSVNLESDLDALSKGLIGFRERGYLSDIGMDDTSQVKFYQGFIKEKGTRKGLESLTRAQIDRLNSDITYFEDWAVRVGEYGALDSTQAVEVLLRESQFAGNPSFFSFIGDADKRPTDRIGIKQSELFKKPVVFNTDLFLKKDRGTSLDAEFKTAGPVRLDDVDLTLFSIEQYKDLNASYNTIGDGTLVWVAKDYAGEWNVYRASTTGVTLTTVTNLGDGLLMLTFAAPHTLAANEVFVVKNVGGLEGAFQVVYVPNETSVVVDFPTGDLGDFDVVSNLFGYVLKLVSVKVDTPNQIAYIVEGKNWREQDTFWVNENDAEGNWAVYEKDEPWKQQSYLRRTVSGFGSHISKSPTGNLVAIASATAGTVSIYERTSTGFVLRTTVTVTAGFVGEIALADLAGVAGALLLVSNKNTGKVSVFKRPSNSYTYAANGTLTGNAGSFGSGIAVSDNGRWLYVGSPVENKVAVYANFGSGYVFVNDIVPPVAQTGEGFGYSVDCTSDGAQVAIGSPNKDASTTIDSGAVYVFDRSVEAFISTGGNQFVTERAFATTTPVVSVDRVETTAFTVVDNTTVKFNSAVTTGKVVRIESSVFNFVGELLPADNGSGDFFGYSVAICPTNCSIYIGSPGSDSVKSSVRNTGSVYRYLNQSRVYGVIESTVDNPVVSVGHSFRIDDFEIVFTGTTLTSVVDAINAKNIPGISAHKTADGKRLVILSASTKSFAKLVIMPGTGTALEDLGLEVFPQVQKIGAPYEIMGTDENPVYEMFGSYVEVSSDASKLLVSSPTATQYVKMTLDGGTTTLDDKSTTVKSTIINAGAAYVYQMLSNPKGTIADPSQMLLAQELVSDQISVGDLFGAGATFYGNDILVGMPGDDTNGTNRGQVAVFVDASGQGAWKVLRTSSPTVDVNSINAVYAYNNHTYEKVETFDFIDPVKGRILGVAAQEIDYLTSQDPAYYNSGNSDKLDETIGWGEKQVGRVWWDLSKVRWLDYEQGEFAYRSVNWGNTFPGSEIKLYEWVESTVSPEEYTGDGKPAEFAANAYTVKVNFDSVTGAYKTKYYFWVENKSKVPAVKTRKLSLMSLVDLIENPLASGIPYVGFLSPSTVGLWNASNLMIDDKIVLHIDYDVKQNQDLIHSEYQLIQEGNASTNIPESVINKIVDSLSGKDAFGNVVPDPNLSEAEKYGIAIRPRQSIFKDQKSALKLLVDSLNAEFQSTPILQRGYNVSGLYDSDSMPVTGFDEMVADLANRDFLATHSLPEGYTVLVRYDTVVSGWSVYTLAHGSWVLTNQQQVNTQAYWSVVDWYAEGHAALTKFTYVIESEYDIARLKLQPYDTIKIKNTGDGNFKIYQVSATGELEIIGLQNATIRVHDTLWKNQPAAEVRNILGSAISIFSGTDVFNEMFFGLIRYALSEQKYVDWIFKTSFITILHKIRKLEQFATYQRDNQNFVREFIEEVKPYRTKIREYLLRYESVDLWNSDITDFDLPGYWDTDFLRFRSPSGENVKDAELYTLPDNVNWYNNYKYVVSEIIVEQAGSGYTVVPQVIIEGGGGTGAKARAIISNGLLRRVVVTDPGVGYTSTPTVRVVGGNGTGAVLSVRISNDTIRKIKTTIAFDRITYRAGNDSGIISAADRVAASYAPRDGMPSNDIAQLFGGVEYGGVNVMGTKFDDPFTGNEDTIIRSFYRDLDLGTRPEDIIVDGGEYVDVYNSHAPEEVVPGIVFDALDMQIYTLAPETTLGSGPDISVLSIVGDGETRVYSTNISGKHNDTVFVYSKVSGQMYEGTDFTFDRNTNLITFNRVLGDGESVFVYLYGDAAYGKIMDVILSADGVTTEFDMPNVENYLVTDTYVTIDGVRQFNYQFTAGASTGSKITFVTAPRAGSHVHVYAYKGTVGKQSFSEIYTQVKTVSTTAYPAGYIVSLDRPLLYSAPLSSKVIVEVNNKRLRPANNRYYISDGSTKVYTVPLTVDVAPANVSNNDIEVYVDGVRLVERVDYTVNPVNGLDPRSVTLKTAAPAGKEVVVLLHAGSEYRVSTNDKVEISKSVNLRVGDKIKIITFSNHDPLKMRTQVYVGASFVDLVAEPGFDGAVWDAMKFDTSIITSVENRIYEFDAATVRTTASVPNPNYLWVTLNGARMMPNYDFVLLDHGKLQFGNHLNITNVDVIVITSITENTQIQPIGYRIFKNMNGDFSYLRLSAENSTVLTKDLTLTDTVIHVADTTALPVPAPDLASPGVIFIDGERITYYEIDHINKTLGRIRRATAGTGAPALHTSGTRVVDAGPDQKVPDDAGRIWMDPGVSKPTTGVGLSFSNTVQARFLKARPSFLPG